MLATVGLLKPARHASRRARSVVWMAFLLGIGVSLAANIAAAPALAWKPVLVAGWPPVALLFSVELLAHRSGDRELTQNAPRDSVDDRARAQLNKVEAKRDESGKRQRENPGGGESVTGGSQPSTVTLSKTELSAEQIMWDHFQQQQAEGRTPTGAELDRVAGTNNYGRAVLARWRRAGRIPAMAE